MTQVPCGFRTSGNKSSFRKLAIPADQTSGQKSGQVWVRTPRFKNLKNPAKYQEIEEAMSGVLDSGATWGPSTSPSSSYVGAQYSSIELQYVGNGLFVPISHEGLNPTVS